MPKFEKGDILYFKKEDNSYHQMTYETIIDKCVVLYLDDTNYYFDSSVLNSMVYDLKKTDQHILNMPIDEVDSGKYPYTIGLKTLLKKL